MSLVLDQNVGHTPSKSRADRAAGMIADLRRLGVPAKLGKLEFGDVSFNGQGPGGEWCAVGAELKTVTGLLQDFMSGRFVGHQIGGMQKAYPFRYLIVEGAFRPGKDGMMEVPTSSGGNFWVPARPAFMYIDFMQLINEVQVQAGFRYVRTWSKLETIYTVAALYRWWQKPWDSHKGLKRFHETSPTVVMLKEPSLLRRWAKELPGVGWERSADVERVFSRPQDLANATRADLESVPGIGKTISLRVWRAIRGIKA